jgi:hypothetical protein
MTSKIARGVKALIGASAVAIVALIVAAPTATAAVSSAVQHHARISVAAPRTTAPMPEEAADTNASLLAQPADRDAGQTDYATASMDEAAPGLPGSVFADAFSPCTGMNWLDD